jgi:hypothetical protein
MSCPPNPTSAVSPKAHAMSCHATFHTHARTTHPLTQEDKTLFEENNMLKFKMEVLLDLYASTRSDYLRMKEQVKKLEAYNESQQAHR